MKRVTIWGVFAYIIACFVLHPLSPLFTHQLADPDDTMRLNEVMSWLNGQSWYDLSMPRLSPGAGTIVHWSRLIDLPIAAIALPFSHFYTLHDALLMASFIVPLLWLIVLLFLLAAWNKAMTGKDTALACLLLLFTPYLLFNFTPGRVDHHGVQAIIAGFGLYSLSRMMRDDRGTLFAALSALFFACGFWIGAEALPWVFLFMCCAAAASAWQGGTMARHSAVFGVCLPLFTAILIPIALSSSEYSSLALSWFSPAYALFAAVSGFVLIAGGWFSLKSTSILGRILFYKICGIGAIAAFFAVVPRMLDGIFTDYDAFDSSLALDNIGEAMPLIQSFHTNPYMAASFAHAALLFCRVLLLPTAAFVGCCVALRRTQGTERHVWLAQSVFLVAATALTMFYQSRVGIYMELFTLVPLAWLLYTTWDELHWSLLGRTRYWAEIVTFSVLSWIPVLLLPALAVPTSVYPDFMLFPAARAAPSCDLKPALNVLNNPHGLGSSTHTIMNVSDAGPELLFATHHNVVSGNFDVPGNADAYSFFHAINDADARAAATKWHADLVLLCTRLPSLYVGQDYFSLSHSILKLGKDNMLRLVNADTHQPLIARLNLGQTPAWLKEIEIPGGSDYLLFEIKSSAEKK